MKNKIPYFFLALAAILAATAFSLLIWGPNKAKTHVDAPFPSKPTIETPTTIPDLDQPLRPDTPEEIFANLGVGLSTADPSELLTRIGLALENGDLASVSNLIGMKALDQAKLEQIDALLKTGSLRVSKKEGVREIGELELNRRARWALKLISPLTAHDHILFDLRKEKGKWSVEKITLPPPPGTSTLPAIIPDSLGAADRFLQAVLTQNFELAGDFVDPTSVSDAKIAALCILFEEGEYRMRTKKPLRAMFTRGDTVGYIGNVESVDGARVAQFALNISLPHGSTNWIVTEINLDSLLADYSLRVADGDTNYSPLVKNPAGGETLALYFAFDEDEISSRTRRQLEIVASLLKADPTKKITVSGHTDALGTKLYNNRLSTNRAEVVRDFLAAEGVPLGQIVTLSKGASQPLRPNITETGEDDPDGRRANRRTEIYLDF